MAKAKGSARKRAGEWKKETLVFEQRPKSTAEHIEEAKGLFVSELAQHVYVKTLEAKDKAIAALQRDRADLIRMLAAFSTTAAMSEGLHWAPVVTPSGTGD